MVTLWKIRKQFLRVRQTVTSRETKLKLATIHAWTREQLPTRRHRQVFELKITDYGMKKQKKNFLVSPQHALLGNREFKNGFIFKLTDSVVNIRHWPFGTCSWRHIFTSLTLKGWTSHGGPKALHFFMLQSFLMHDETSHPLDLYLLASTMSRICLLFITAQRKSLNTVFMSTL